jgi:DNA-binding MarR family transcriptional regulator
MMAPMEASDGPGFMLPLQLLAAFRSVVDQVHDELGRRGHPDARPLHAFALQAIGPAGSTTAELGRRLGISKQGAAKTVRSLERLGYIRREADPSDRRAKIIRRSRRGEAFLAISAAEFDRVRERIAASLGRDGARRLEADLRLLAPDLHHARFADFPGWLGSGG